MRVVKQTEPTQIEWTEFGGLDLQPDRLSRPFNSWRRADNVDLFIPGAIRKIVGPNHFSGPFPSPVLEMFNYLRDSSRAMIRVALCANGHLYDLDALTDLGFIGNVAQPWVGLFGGTVTGGFSAQYAVITTAGGQPVKWESVGGATPIGVSQPTSGLSLSFTQTAVNANAYLMQVGIQYLWTYWNPITLHESSPSPVPDTAIITPTVNQPAPATPYITQVQLSIPTPDPAIGTGYSRIRVYRTQDGGATFFLLPALYDAGGNNVLDSNGSAPRIAPTSTYSDGFAAGNESPAPDQLMVNPPGGAPAPDGHNPPPAAIWGAVYQGRLWLLDPNGRRLWFSEEGDFQSFGIFNFFDFSKDIDDVITALQALSDRLIVFGKGTARQITGTDFSDFVEVPVDMRRGCKGRRAAATDGDIIYLLTFQSLARLAFSQSGPPFLGDRIKPLTDTIQPDPTLWASCMEIDTSRGQMVFAVRVNGVAYSDVIIVTDLSKESPFTKIVGLPAEVITIRELENLDGTRDMYISTADQSVSTLYGGVGALTATLETQLLPLTDFNIWRVFTSIDIYGTDLRNWFLATSMDGVNFSPQIAVGIPEGSFVTRVGQAGRQVVLQLQHKVNNGVAALVSRMKMEYEDKMGGF